MLEFVDEKKIVVDKKKVTIATKKIPYDAFLVLQKVVEMDQSAYESMHETFGLRLNSGRKTYKIPPIADIVAPWAEAVQSYVESSVAGRFLCHYPPMRIADVFAWHCFYVGASATTHSLKPNCPSALQQ